MSDRLSDRTLELLEEAGWGPQRAVETAGYAEASKKAGMSLHATAEAFLQQFGGLNVSFEQRKGPGAPVKKGFHFHADAAVENWESDLVNEWSERVKSPMSVIGETDLGGAVLAMDGAGKVYAGSYESLAQIGESGLDAVEALCTGRKPLRVLG